VRATTCQRHGDSSQPTCSTSFKTSPKVFYPHRCFFKGCFTDHLQLNSLCSYRSHLFPAHPPCGAAARLSNVVPNRVLHTVISVTSVPRSRWTCPFLSVVGRRAQGYSANQACSQTNCHAARVLKPAPVVGQRAVKSWEQVHPLARPDPAICRGKHRSMTKSSPWEMGSPPVLLKRGPRGSAQSSWLPREGCRPPPQPQPPCSAPTHICGDRCPWSPPAAEEPGPPRPPSSPGPAYYTKEPPRASQA